jgi:hypothetical protein
MASTMLMWLVPYSGWSGMGAWLVRTAPGLPGVAVFMLCGPIRRARLAR